MGLGLIMYWPVQKVPHKGNYEVISLNSADTEMKGVRTLLFFMKQDLMHPDGGGVPLRW